MKTKEKETCFEDVEMTQTVLLKAYLAQGLRPQPVDHMFASHPKTQSANDATKYEIPQAQPTFSQAQET